MHKELHLLGLLRAGPRTGYELHRIVVAHGELYTDLKKGNVYYLLERLEAQGFLTVTTHPGAPGPRRERLVYSITDAGRRHFHDLLREVVRTYQLAHTGIEVGMVFLDSLDPQEAVALLEERRKAVQDRRAVIEREACTAHNSHQRLAEDHLLCLVDAELLWIDRTVLWLRTDFQRPNATPASTPTASETRPPTPHATAAGRICPEPEEPSPPHKSSPNL